MILLSWNLHHFNSAVQLQLLLHFVYYTWKVIEMLAVVFRSRITSVHYSFSEVCPIAKAYWKLHTEHAHIIYYVLVWDLHEAELGGSAQTNMMLPLPLTCTKEISCRGLCLVLPTVCTVAAAAAPLLLFWFLSLECCFLLEHHIMLYM